MDAKYFALLSLVTMIGGATIGNAQVEPCAEVICPHFLDPVCGLFETHLVPFANECEFENESCRLRKHGKMVRLGDCPDWHVFTK